MNETAAAPVVRSKGYRWRLLWFVVIAVFASLWFERHLKAYVSQTAIVGGTVTLFALWKLALDALGVAGEKGPADWVRRAFTSDRAPGYLGFATLLIGALWACTSSIYLTYDSDSRGSGTYRVEIWQGNRLLRPAEELSPHDKFVGQPYFFHFGREDLEFRIVKPPGYEAKKIPWSMGSQITVPVPYSWDPLELHLVKIVPGKDFLISLPPTATSPGLRYRLVLERMGPHPADPADTVVVEPFLKTVVFTGMPEVELAAATGDVVIENTRVDVERMLTRMSALDERRPELIEQLFASVARRPIGRLVVGDKLRMRVYSLSAAPDAQPVLKADQVLELKDRKTTMHVVTLEKLPQPAGGTP
jgi:hypothetical protein